MTPGYRRLAWIAALATYLLIVLGAWVRISGSGMGCGDHWPLCNGKLFPPLDDPKTVIEWTHRLVVSLVSLPIAGLAIWTWILRKGAGSPKGRGGERSTPGRAAYLAVGLVGLAAALGRATVILELPAWTTILHFATAITLLATLIMAADGRMGGWPRRSVLVAGALTAATLLLGALTANAGAAAACGGFPLCNGQLIPDGGALQTIHWTHRLLAYGLLGYAIIWAARARARGAYVVLGLVVLQAVVAALMVLSGLPRGLQALHVAVGVAVWGVLVNVAVRPSGSDMRTVPEAGSEPLAHGPGLRSAARNTL